MEYKRLGKSGLKLSRFSYGSWLTFGIKVDLVLAKKIMKYCYDHGVNFFDNAEIYAYGKSEEIMGKALKELKFSRDTFCVSSKAFWGGEKPTQKGLSKKHLVDACHAALKRLQVDYLDLYFCHRPDINTPIEETVFAMNSLIDQGKILYWGTSEWEPEDIAMAHIFARQNNLIPPTMEQPQYNMLERKRLEQDYLRIFKELGLGTTIWSPLASGILTGKYNNGIPKGSRATLKEKGSWQTRFNSLDFKKNIEKVKLLTKIANDLDCTMYQLALAWCLKNVNVSTVILGATKMDQIKENINSLQVVSKLNDEIMNKIESILKNKPEGRREF